VIRAAGPDDFDAVMRLHRQLLPDDPVLRDGSDRAAFETILRTPGLTLSVLERDGTLVASTYLNVIPNISRRASPYAIVENVIVDESLRGRGLGRQIMAATLEAAWAAGCYKAMLATGSKNPATHAFYLACGFVAGAKTSYLARPPAPVV
jgi:GNAT superfamily N-acetyltransferase